MAKQKKYQARKGGPIKDADAQIIGERIEYLMVKNGREITPEEVVEDASMPSSPIHEYFDWDDTTAAKKYRLWQARRILGSVIEVVVVAGKKEATRSFFNVRSDEGDKKGKSVYVTVDKISKTPSYRLQLLSEAEQKMVVTLNMIKLLKQEFK